MEDRTYKGVIAVALVAVIFAVAVYGSYLPMRKAQIFIATLQDLQANHPSSLSDLEARIAVPLDYPSPIGQGELVRNTANSILSFIQNTQDATTTAGLLSFLGHYHDPIIVRGRGMSFGQDLYLEGAIHEVAFSATGNPAYLAQSIDYYQKGEALGPDRPQTLYGLFDV